MFELCHKVDPAIQLETKLVLLLLLLLLRHVHGESFFDTLDLLVSFGYLGPLATLWIPWTFRYLFVTLDL